MMRKIVSLLLLSILSSQTLLADPITFDAAGVKKITDIRRSIENPIVLYQRLNGAVADGKNNFFLSQTLQNLNPGAPMSAYDTKVLHKLICGSNVLQGDPSTENYGYLGFYDVGTKIVGIPAIPRDNASRLDVVLKQIGESQFVTAPEKEWAQKYFITGMAKAISNMHGRDVIANNVSLNNFYLAPAGGVVPADLSEITISAVENVKNTEWKKFATDTMPQVFRLLYPNSVDDGEFIAFITAAIPALGGVAPPNRSSDLGGAVPVAADWSTFAWTRNHVIHIIEDKVQGVYNATDVTVAGLQAAGGPAAVIAAAAVAPTINDRVGFRFDGADTNNYLARVDAIPFGPNLPMLPGLHSQLNTLPLLTKAQHLNVGINGGGTVHLPDALRDLMSTNLNAVVAAIGDTAALCAIPSWR